MLLDATFGLLFFSLHLAQAISHGWKKDSLILKIQNDSVHPVDEENAGIEYSKKARKRQEACLAAILLVPVLMVMAAIFVVIRVSENPIKWPQRPRSAVDLWSINPES